MPALARRLYRGSIWHPDAIPPEEWKYRMLKRIWLPLFDVIAFGAGVWALMFGSPLLHRVLHEMHLPVLAGVFAVASAAAFIGVAFPAFWRIEIIGKVTMLSLMGGYAATIAVMRANPEPAAGFIIFVLALGFPLPLLRLGLLGEEIKERRKGEV